ncbi:hypothetical protein Syun_021243 [Stephania yunnanensis]|uniref:Uncharacterized protein n=1 Tax=Stephania yunnanensis TaxID=152371 RepID=A0AAP0NS44_9MAGN
MEVAEAMEGMSSEAVAMLQGDHEAHLAVAAVRVISDPIRMKVGEVVGSFGVRQAARGEGEAAVNVRAVEGATMAAAVSGERR